MLCESSKVLCCVLIVLHHGGSLDATFKEKEDEVVIKKITNTHNTDQYTFSYSLSDGQFRYERGRLKKSDVGKEPVWAVIGMYEYVSPEGKVIRYKYTADEKGFRQSSDERIEPQIIDMLTSDDSEPDEPEEATGRAVGSRIDYKALISLVG